MTFYIGVDGGGTQTSFACYNDSGQELASRVLSTSHVAQVTEQEAQAILKTGVESLIEGLSLNVHSQTVRICAGLAGYGINQNFRHKIEENCRIAFEGFDYLIYNDAEVALMGALNGEDGMLIVAGTGSIGYAKSLDTIYRVGGWGYMLGDEGSAYWIAKQILQTFTKQSDGRLPKTPLYSVLRAELGIQEDGELVQYVAENLYSNRTASAQLAKLGSKLLQLEDATMKEIYSSAGAQLAELANGLVGYFQSSKISIPVSTIGGVWSAGELVKKGFTEQLVSQLHYQPALHSATFGAFLLAKRGFNQE